MKVQRILDADIYRDGGSYSFVFESDDGHWYDFFLRTRAFEADGASHHAPVIYRGSANDGQVVQKLTWAEAKQFVAALRYDGKRFAELLHVIETEGARG